MGQIKSWSNDLLGKTVEIRTRTGEVCGKALITETPGKDVRSFALYQNLLSGSFDSLAESYSYRYGRVGSRFDIDKALLEQYTLWTRTEETFKYEILC